MAERRMFAKTIIDSDAFLDMPQSTQLLYFHLAMRADDDGFINNPRSIMRNTRCNDDDLKVLVTKKFIIPFESGIVVIKHWKIHNYIAKDRYKGTKYQEEMSTLYLDENKAYTQTESTSVTPCIQPVYKTDTQVRLGQVSLGKDRSGKDSVSTPEAEESEKITFGTFKNVLLTLEEYTQLQRQFPDTYKEHIEKFSNGLEQYGYKYKNHYAAILQWVENDKKKREEQQSESGTETSSNPFYALGKERGVF